MPVSATQAAKRLLITLLVTFGRHYQVNLTVSRDSCDKDVVKYYRKVLLKAHPDKGGRPGDAQQLLEAREVWENAKKNAAPQPPPATAASMHPPDDSIVCAKVSAKNGFRINSLAVLLTYFGFSGLSHWLEFSRLVPT